MTILCCLACLSLSLSLSHTHTHTHTHTQTQTEPDKHRTLLSTFNPDLGTVPGDGSIHTQVSRTPDLLKKLLATV